MSSQENELKLPHLPDLSRPVFLPHSSTSCPVRRMNWSCPTSRSYPGLCFYPIVPHHVQLGEWTEASPPPGVILACVFPLSSTSCPVRRMNWSCPTSLTYPDLCFYPIVPHYVQSGEWAEAAPHPWLILICVFPLSLTSWPVRRKSWWVNRSCFTSLIYPDLCFYLYSPTSWSMRRWSGGGGSELKRPHFPDLSVLVFFYISPVPHHGQRGGGAGGWAEAASPPWHAVPSQ